MTKHKLKILWSSNSPWTSSGYAVQTKEITYRMRDAGYEIGLVNFYGQEGGIIEHDGMKMYPKMGSVWGEDALLSHSNDFMSDVNFTSQDIWTLDMNILRQIRRWIPHVPIDHQPPPPGVTDRLRMAYRIVSVSQFGKKELEKKGLYSTYIPYTVDTTVMKPFDKMEARKAFGLPIDMFLFGMVAANKDYPPRKSYQEVMDAFKLFHDKYPKSGIFMHINILQGNVFPIDQYANFLGIQEFIFHIEPYKTMYKIDSDAMKKIYSSLDCLMAPSTNEGFGVPIIESQACGTPVITNNFTAMPELVVQGKTGYVCETDYKYFTPMLGYIGIPSTSSIHNSMLEVYKTDREKMGKEAREHVVKNYDSDTVFKKYWLPFLQILEDEVNPIPPPKVDKKS